MSIEMHVFMEDSRVPSRDAWQQAIDEAGFSAVLDPSYDLRKDSGFCPTIYNGQESGFELYLDPAVNLLKHYKEIAEQVGKRDKCISFRFGGRENEADAAMSCAAALTILTDGIFLDSETGESYNPETIMKYAIAYVEILSRDYSEEDDDDTEEADDSPVTLSKDNVESKITPASNVVLQRIEQPKKWWEFWK